MNLGDPALSHVPRETGASSSTQLVFRISDGSNQSGIDVRISQPDHVRRWSVGLRKLMDEEATSNEVPINVDRNSSFDCAAVAWVLEEQQGQQPNITPNPETLAPQCAVLWKYECNPDSFKNLGDTMQPRSSSGSPSMDQQSSFAPSASSSGGSRSWSGKKNDITCGHLITIALVLGLEDILEEEIRIAVWGANKKVMVAIPLMDKGDIEAIRREELEQLFNKVQFEIIEIQEHNEKLATSIRETLKQYKIANFWKPWSKVSEEMKEENWTPFDFLRAVENALAPESQSQGLEPHPRNRPVSRGRDTPNVNWMNIIGKTKKAVKDTLHINEGKEVAEDQDKKSKILDSLEALILERCHALAVHLMTRRNLIVQQWKDKLKEA